MHFGFTGFQNMTGMEAMVITFNFFLTVVSLKGVCILSSYLAYNLYVSQQNSQRLFPMLLLSVCFIVVLF